MIGGLPDFVFTARDTELNVIGYVLPAQELREAKTQMTEMANKVYEAIRVSPEHSEEEELIA